MPTRKNKILVTGRPGVGKLALVKRILSIYPDSSQAPPENSTQPLCIPWTIDTKYYTAEVGFWVDSAEGVTETDVEAWEVLKDAVDGFMFVFNRSKPETFEDIRAWSKFLERVQPNVAVCVANTPGTTDERAPSVDVDVFEDWCIANGVEFVDVDTSAASRAGDGSALEDVRKDRVGFERIVEALETNMWDGMRRKQIPARARQEAEEEKDSALDNPDDSMRKLVELLGVDFADDWDGDGDPGDLDAFEESVLRLKRLRGSWWSGYVSFLSLSPALMSLQTKEYNLTLPEAERRAALSLGLESVVDTDSISFWESLGVGQGGSRLFNNDPTES
ncbi:hypothetical protein HK104_000752 [Borealophlyctis nickersoniae]|nr:hypothetical protein HK104_000752 [Borealophlyctis nickersoniae]